MCMHGEFHSLHFLGGSEVRTEDPTMSMKPRATVFLLALVGASAHSTLYPEQRIDNCTDDANPPPFLSYHIHVLFWPRSAATPTLNASSVVALDLQKRFIAEFSPGAPCTGLFHQGRLCMFDVDYVGKGPFVTAQWSAFIPIEDFARTVSWVMQRRGELDVLVHPNSGCGLEDHTRWPLWGGKPWEINRDLFAH